MRIPIRDNVFCVLCELYLSDVLIVDFELPRMWKETVMAHLNFLPSIFVEELKKIRKPSVKQPLGRDSIRIRHEQISNRKATLRDPVSYVKRHHSELFD
jgi:hypothetical protein